MNILRKFKLQSGTPEYSGFGANASSKPVRGCLIIEKGTPDNIHLFVFRRRELEKTRELAMEPRFVERTGNPSVRFDEGSETDGHWQRLSPHRFRPTLLTGFGRLF